MARSLPERSERWRGVALGGLSMSLAFEFHTGIKAANLTAENPAGFVAALNTTFIAAIVFCVAGIFTSALRGREKPLPADGLSMSSQSGIR